MPRSAQSVSLFGPGELAVANPLCRRARPGPGCRYCRYLCAPICRRILVHARPDPGAVAPASGCRSLDIGRGCRGPALGTGGRLPRWRPAPPGGGPGDAERPEVGQRCSEVGLPGRVVAGQRPSRPTPSSWAASASGWRPRSCRRLPRLFSASASSGWWAGLSRASSRHRPTASSAAASASGAAQADQTAPEEVQRPGEIGLVGGVVAGQLPPQADGSPRRRPAPPGSGPGRPGRPRGWSAPWRSWAGGRGCHGPAPATAGRLPRWRPAPPGDGPGRPDRIPRLVSAPARPGW